MQCDSERGTVVTLTLIGESLPDHENVAHVAAATELTLAVAATAPRGCSARLLIAADHSPPVLADPRARVERLPMKADSLRTLWRSGVSARPLDGALVHAPTPLVPLRNRSEYDDSQTSVTVPHALGWLAIDAMGVTAARHYRAFVKRAVKHADIIVTPTHATAVALHERYGEIPVQVIPHAPPAHYLAGPHSAERRDALGLPTRYVATTAWPGDTGRLEWLVGAYTRDASLPPLVLLTHSTAAIDSIAITAAKSTLGSRLHVIQVQNITPATLGDTGAVLAGAEVMAMPQAHIGSGYEVLGALAAGVPIVHAGCAATAELALEGGVEADGAEEFARTLADICSDAERRRLLGLLADDRSRAFAWHHTALALWELHANL